MYKNGEFDEYDRYNKEMETYLADALVQVEKDSDEWAYEYAKNKVAFLKEHKDLPRRRCLGCGISGIVVIIPLAFGLLWCGLFICNVLLGRTDVDPHQIHQLPGIFPWNAGDYCG